MADWTITLEGATDAAFTTGVTSGTFSILGATPWRTPISDAVISFGHIGRNATDWVREIVVIFDRFKTETDATGDTGDLVLLESIIFSPYVRITEIDTTRTDGTTDGDLWPAIIGDGLPVYRRDYAPSADAASGSDTLTLTLVSVYPMV